MQININELDFNSLIICAFRYALGRMTYTPNIISKIIQNNLEKLNNQTINLIIKELEEAEKIEDLGMECDKDVWLTLKERLKKYESKMY